MQCPTCQREMEAGFVQSKSEIIYSAREKLLAIPIRKKGDIRLTTNPIAPATCQAWHCGACRRIILDYDEWQVKD